MRFTDKMNYSIVTIGYKSLQNIKACVDEAYQSTLPPNEFVLLINPYDQQTAKDILTYAASEPRITRYAYMSQNVGVATAWNLGMAMSTSDYIVVLNDDCRVGPQTYENMIREFSNPRVGIVGVESGGNPGDAKPTAKGFLLAFSKELFLNIGGYPEKSSPLADEVEFGLRAWANGYETAIAKNCSWSHIHDISNNPQTTINYLGSPWTPTKDQPDYLNYVKPVINQYNERIRNENSSV